MLNLNALLCFVIDSKTEVVSSSEALPFLPDLSFSFLDLSSSSFLSEAEAALGWAAAAIPTGMAPPT